jgi:hypothetical protein
MNSIVWTTVSFLSLNDPTLRWGFTLMGSLTEIVRQVVLCAGDTTLDHSATTEGRSTFTGNEAKHQCRDWETIKNWMEKHGAGNKTGIL